MSERPVLKLKGVTVTNDGVSTKKNHYSSDIILTADIESKDSSLHAISGLIFLLPFFAYFTQFGYRLTALGEWFGNRDIGWYVLIHLFGAVLFVIFPKKNHTIRLHTTTGIIDLKKLRVKGDAQAITTLINQGKEDAKTAEPQAT